MKVKVTQSCLTLCDLMDYTVLGILQVRILERVAVPFSRGSSNPGIEPRSPTLQADSLTAEPQGKPKNTRVGRVAYPFSSGSSWQRNQIRVCCIAGRFFTSWAIREVLSGENLFITVRLGCRLCFEDGLKDNGSMYLTPGKGPWVTNHINKEKQNKTKKTETHLYPHAK